MQQQEIAVRIRRFKPNKNRVKLPPLITEEEKQLRKETKMVVEAATVKASENFVLDILDDIATEEAEKLVLKKMPEL